MDDYLVNFAILLDTLVLTLFIYFAIETARQGFIINVVNSLRYIIAYFMALNFSERCTRYVYNNFISSQHISKTPNTIIIFINHFIILLLLLTNNNKFH